MHDPLVVAFEVRLPIPRRNRIHDARPGQPRWTLGRRTRTNPENLGEPVYPWWRPIGYHPRVAGRGFGWWRFLTIWHDEPGGADSGEVCKHYSRVQASDGKWSYHIHHGWKFHVHHWHIQWHQYQALRRRLLTRCQWCGGRGRKRDPVNISKSWDRDKDPWWRGERGLFHHDCSSIDTAHHVCLCADGVGIWEHELSGYPYGNCLTCGKYRGWRQDDGEFAHEANRILASIPQGQRDPVKSAQVTAMWRAHHAATPEGSGDA